MADTALTTSRTVSTGSDEPSGGGAFCITIGTSPAPSTEATKKAAISCAPVPAERGAMSIRAVAPPAAA
jgi:hypothetical protein